MESRLGGASKEESGGTGVIVEVRLGEEIVLGIGGEDGVGGVIFSEGSGSAESGNKSTEGLVKNKRVCEGGK